MSANKDALSARMDAGAERAHRALKQSIEKTSSLQEAKRLFTEDVRNDVVVVEYIVRDFLNRVARDRPDLDPEELVEEALRRLQALADAKK